MVLRLTWLFGLPERCKKTNSNIIWNIIKSAMKNQQIKLPQNEHRGITYICDLLKNFDKILDLPSGFYNTGSENDLSTYEVGEIILKELELGSKIEEILIKDIERYKTLSRDLRISNSKLKDYGIYFSNTEEAISNCVSDFSFKIV